MGPARTIVATARRIAHIVHFVHYMLKLKAEYHAIAADEYEQRFRQRETEQLELARMLQAAARSESVRCPSNAEGYLQ